MNIIRCGVNDSTCMPIRLHHGNANDGLLCAVRFPGSDFAWNAVNDVTDVDLLSQASIHVSTHQQCENQAYNISNGDLFRWKEVSASTSS